MTVPANRSPTLKSKGSAPSPNSKAIQIKKPGITVKRKPQPANKAGLEPSNPSTSMKSKTAKKDKTENLQTLPNNSSKSSKGSAPAVSVVIDVEVTLCPICDEACTCPKTIVVDKSPVKKTPAPASSLSKKPASNKKTTNSSSKNNRSVKPKSKSYLISDEEVHPYDDYEEESDFDSTGHQGEDSALSFIRMIYSDEDSLDEEEAYALYQAAQLFSSSSEEDGYSDYSDAENGENIFYASQGEEHSNDDGEDDSEEEDFEYTVVEYVQPRRKKLSANNTEFIAYNSSDSEGGEASDAEENSSNLLVNANNVSNASDEDEEEDEEEEDAEEGADYENDFEDSEENWMTYSVFDVDRDLALNQLNGFSHGSTATSLSSQGSGTPETLLFSASSTDKIPNIAPQVLAAISAAAKHMANSNNINNGNGNSNSRYFSYITLKDPHRGEDVNEEEFLFFEESFETSDGEEEESEFEGEGEGEGEGEENIMEIDDQDVEMGSDDCDAEVMILQSGTTDFEEYETNSSSYDCEDSFSEGEKPEKLKSTRKKLVNPIVVANAVVSTNTTAANNSGNLNSFFNSLNRWNRVPIGAFRRSRRPSIPNLLHQIHPTLALKSFSTDPANAAVISSVDNDDSFDEGTANAVGIMERSQSVVSWDELDISVVQGASNNASANASANNNNNFPLPKRSRSVIPSNYALVNNYEWLNNTTWNWEI